MQPQMGVDDLMSRLTSQHGLIGDMTPGHEGVRKDVVLDEQIRLRLDERPESYLFAHARCFDATSVWSSWCYRVQGLGANRERPVTILFAPGTH